MVSSMARDTRWEDGICDLSAIALSEAGDSFLFGIHTFRGAPPVASDTFDVANDDCTSIGKEGDVEGHGEGGFFFLGVTGILEVLSQVSGLLGARGDCLEEGISRIFSNGRPLVCTIAITQ